MRARGFDWVLTAIVTCLQKNELLNTYSTLAELPGHGRAHGEAAGTTADGEHLVMLHAARGCQLCRSSGGGSCANAGTVAGHEGGRQHRSFLLAGEAAR